MRVSSRENKELRICQIRFKYVSIEEKIVTNSIKNNINNKKPKYYNENTTIIKNKNKCKIIKKNERRINKIKTSTSLKEHIEKVTKLG